MHDEHNKKRRQFLVFPFPLLVLPGLYTEIELSNSQ